MERTLKFPGLKPFSVNSAYVRTFSGVSKSSAASEWTAQFFNILSRTDNQQAISDLREAFDEKAHAYGLEIVAYYPDFYTKKGAISNKTLDLSNTEKVLVDCLFLPKFNDEVFPYGCPNLNQDDRILVDLVSRKRPGELAIEVKVKIVERP